LGNISGTVFTLGDNVYPYGSTANFRNCYDPTWGKYKKRTKPTLGNHEYYDENYNMTTDAGPYFDYFGARAGARGEGYYSYDRGAWHIVALNSNCGKVGGCESVPPRDAGSERPRQQRQPPVHHGLLPPPALLHRHQRRGPRREALLEDAPRPRRRPDRQRARPPLRALRPDDPGRDAFGQRHPPDRRRDRGAGGGSEISYADAPNLQRVKIDVYGVLKLSLRADSYSWKFVRAAGKEFTDRAPPACH
jgi:hypothetical protein